MNDDIGPAPGALWCQTLNGLSVRLGTSSVDLAGPKQRLLLALLLCHVNSQVSVDHLTSALWPEHPPRTATKNLHVYVSKLRKVFGDRLSHTGRGYRLRLRPQECDLLLFDERVNQARALAREGRTGSAAAAFEQAMVISTDHPLAEFETDDEFAAPIRTWRERYFGVLEDWAELQLALGDGRPVIDHLSPHPRSIASRERLGAAWMRALSAVGRSNEALAHFELVRRRLARDLGTEPGALLTVAHQEVLHGNTSPPGQASTGSAPTPGNVSIQTLPRDVDGFVGREHQIHRLVENFTENGRQPALVVGPVGSGTSAVGLHVAHLLDDVFPDGKILIDLRSGNGRARTLHAVLRELAETVGMVPDHPSRQAHQRTKATRPTCRRCGPAPSTARHRTSSPAKLLAAWRTWIVQRKVLLVLDNAEDEDVVRALLPPTGDSGVIVTGRSRLGALDGVIRVPLPPLKYRESLDLMRCFVGQRRITADPQATDHILELCQGLPLAVRVTAERLATLDHLSPRAYLEHLRSAPTLLDEMTTGTLALGPRYEGLYRSLTQEQQAAFARLIEGDTHHAAPGDAQKLLECGLLVTQEGSLQMPWFAEEFGSKRIHTRL
jgi:DNA-binding SARP family transcriptional activator